MKQSILLFRLMSLLFVFLFYGMNAYSVPANPQPGYFKQGDGSLLYVYLKGDEKIKWAETADGYTILLNQKGEFEYAHHNLQGDLVLTGKRAHNVEERTTDEIHFIGNLQKKISYSIQQKQIFKQLWEIEENIQNSQPIRSPLQDGTLAALPSSSFHIPIILVNYTDVKFSYSKKDFEDLLNQANYKVGRAYGSVYDYFYSNSLGKLSFVADLYGPVELPKNRAWYGANSAGSKDVRPREMVDFAVKAVNDSGCNFAKYDLNNDGVVDGVHVIFAGVGEESGSGGVPDAIWSHSWVLSPSVFLDGKRIYGYSCSPELLTPTVRTNIGVIIHEISHVMGLPDFYDTDYQTNGQSIDLGQYDVMAGGSWNNSGIHPPLHNAWSRVQLKWQTPFELKDSASIVLGSCDTSQFSYFYKTSTQRETFVLENKRKEGWDLYIPSAGLIIYHVDENNPYWSRNCINCYPNKRGFYIKQSNGGINSDARLGPGTPFPGSANKTEFTDATIPNSKSWSGQPSAKPITNIKEAGGVIRFDFMGGAPIAPPPPPPSLDTLYTLLALTPVNGSLKVKLGDSTLALGILHTFKKGSNLSLKAFPDSGYMLKSWGKEKDTTQLSRDYVLNNNDTIFVLFKKIPEEEQPLVYCKVVILPTTHGFITVKDSANNSLKSGDSLVLGSRIYLQAYPNPNYLLKAWWDGDPSSSKILTLSKSLTISASFEKIPEEEQPLVYCKVVILPTTHGSITVKDSANNSLKSGDSLVLGSRIYLQAYPNPNYLLKAWWDGDPSSSKILTLSKSLTISASFKKIPEEEQPLVYFKFTIQQPEYGRIELKDSVQNILVSGDSLVAGSRVHLQAYPNPNYLLKAWWDGDTLNPKRIYLTKDFLISAELRPKVSVETTKENGHLLYTSFLSLYIQNLQAGEMVSIYTVDGKCIYQQKVHSSSLEVPLHKGLFIVKIGEKNYKVGL